GDSGPGETCWGFMPCGAGFMPASGARFHSEVERPRNTPPHRQISDGLINSASQSMLGGRGHADLRPQARNRYQGCGPAPHSRQLLRTDGAPMIAAELLNSTTLLLGWLLYLPVLLWAEIGRASCREGEALCGDGAGE